MIRDLKKLAKRDGIDWQTVEQTARDMIRAAEDGAYCDHQIRREVYERTCPKGKEKLPFWKSIGQWDNPRYKGAFGGGNDYMVICGWIEMAWSIAQRFPQLAQNDEAPQNLYDLILSKPIHVPKRPESLKIALEMICGETLSEIQARQAAVPF